MTPHSVPSITLYLLTCTTRCAASSSWLVWRQLKDSSGKLKPQANGCYRNRTYVHCSPSFPCHLPKYLVTLWCAPACADPVLRVKIEQYRGIHISSRTAAYYSRLHLQQASPGRMVFFQILALWEHFVSRYEKFKTHPRTSLFERSPPESVFINLTSSLKARGRSDNRTLSPSGADRGPKQVQRAERWLRRDRGERLCQNWSNGVTHCSEVLLSLCAVTHNGVTLGAVLWAS